MTILTAVATTAARHLVCGICKTTGVVSEEDAERAFHTVVAHFSDHSQKLPRVVAAANDRAWKTLEIALGGERFYGWLTSATDKSLANDIRRHLDALSPAQLPGDRAEFQKACLKELREARERKLLSQGGLTPQSLRQQAGDPARFADPGSLADAQRQTAGAVAGILIAEGFASLGCFLGLPTPHGPLLLVAFDWYFTDAVAKDAELSNKLILAKLDRVTDAGMGKVAGLIDSRLAEIEAVLADIADAVIETRDRVRRVEDKIDRMMQLLAAKGVRDGTVRLTDGIVLQGQEDESLLTAFDLEVRAIPEAERLRPDLVLINARLASAKGQHDQAISDYHRVAEAASDQRVRAEARYGAYRATLERASRSKKPEDWTAALAELNEAAKLDPHLYAPFDLGKYEPLKILGVGGFGVTFLCRHRVGEGRVVIKTLLEEQTDEQQRQRVLDEGRVLMKFDHPNVIRIFDIEFAARPDQRPYFVMEYCDGFTDLEQYVAQHGTLKHAELRTVAVKVAEGLKAAHAAGVLHRDIKPANILVKKETRPEGAVWHVKLIDFGLALRNDLLQAGRQGSTSKQGRSILAGEIAGTLAYAPPEQMDPERQGEIGVPSDLYSFGRTCYYALFKTPTPDDDNKEKLPQQWRTLLSRCTAQEDISKRPKSADEIIKALAEGGKDVGPDANKVALKAACASLLPGLGHILIGQAVKGGIFMAVGLLFLLGWWWHVALVVGGVVGGLLVLGGLPAAMTAAFALLGGGIHAATDRKWQRVVMAVACLSLPFLILPAIWECPWPALFVAWVLVTATDAAITARTFAGKKQIAVKEASAGVEPLLGAETIYAFGRSEFGPIRFEELADVLRKGRINDDSYVFIKSYKKEWVRFKEVKGRLPSGGDAETAPGSEVPDWTLFGVRMSQFDAKRAGWVGVVCVGCIVTSLLASGWLFGPSSRHREAEAQPDPKLLGRWVKAGSRNDKGEEESVVITAGTILYSKPRVRAFGLEQHTSRLSWMTSSKAKLKSGAASVQFDVVSEREIVVSSEEVGFGDFRGIDGHYRRSEGGDKRVP